jgi:heme A synthase
MMMTQEQFVMRKKATTGDAAVDGLLAGIAAGVVMALFLLIVGALSGVSPADVVGRFAPAQANSPLVGLLTHLAVSAIYGVIYGLLFLALSQLRSGLARFGWLAGFVYGLLLYAIASGAIRAGADSGLAYYTTPILLAAHAVYGLVTGIIIGRKWG